LKIPGYNIDLEEAVKTIKKNNCKKVLLMVPEGLKTHISKFVEFLENETNATIVISGDPCFGACETGYYELDNLDFDLIVHIGHLSIPDIVEGSIPIVFVNAMSDLDIGKVIEKAIPSIDGKKIGLVTTAQHVHILKDVKKILKNNNFEPVIGIGDKRIHSKGQILGCNFSAATSIAEKVDMFLFIGSGSFHPLGLILSTRKPVIACDPYTNEVRYKELDELKDVILRQRYGAIARSKDAKVLGILLGTKKGQQRLELAHNIKKKLDENKKKSFIIASNHFTPSHLESFRDIDCFISTACPRIAIDDYMQYETPIITPVELDILLGIKKWEEYQFDEIINP
jgi:2-(3-amino-3-carboxypropyl)histidine synthase